MKILVLNSGSSSIKFQLFNSDDFSVLAVGLLEKIGEEQSVAKIEYGSAKQKLEQKIANHQEGLALINKMFIDYGVLQDLNEIGGVGHRVVHGGERFTSAVIITDEIIEIIKELCIFAPLHNPANLQGIVESKKTSPNAKQVAVFDTAFHHTIPPHAYMYGLPYEMYEKHKIRRYGFHGTSHYYVAKKAAEFLNKPLNQTSLVTLHLGNGASVCAIENGKSIDTSMGFTPLEGVMMGTRCGDIDPAIIPYLQEQFGYTAKDIDSMLNKQSGLKGVCGHNDLREVLELADGGDTKAALALEMFCYKIHKYLGAYLSILKDVDAIVFTGGIGEHSAIVRKKVCAGLERMGIAIDEKLNDSDISTAHTLNKSKSAIKILEIPTNEELEIAMQTKALI